MRPHLTMQERAIYDTEMRDVVGKRSMLIEAIEEMSEDTLKLICDPWPESLALRDFAFALWRHLDDEAYRTAKNVAPSEEDEE